MPFAAQEYDFQGDLAMNSISSVHSHAIFTRQPTQAAQLHDTKQTANPAQSARSALVDRPDLAAKPFGSIASLFAKGLPLPPMETVPDPVTPDIVTDPAVQDPAAPESSST
jgi:hypothetical protein